MCARRSARLLGLPILWLYNQFTSSTLGSVNRYPTAKKTDAIREGFVDAWCRLLARHPPDFAEIARRYSEPHRAYHKLEHILECLRWLAASRELAEHPFEVELALIYHDVVYDPRRVDNERRSAELFRAHARASHLPAASIERIVALIEGTAAHRVRDGDGALVNDIDIAVLGSSPHAFLRYEDEIREEYRHVDEALFRVGRERILRSFFEVDSIYSTPFFSLRLEAQARTNLSRSLSALREAGRSDGA
jgi:predicted metal-dependent HD superfamily phosphohydrolase